MDRVWECVDHAAQEVGAVHLSGVIAEFDVGELRDPVDGEEHVEFAFCQPQLADVDMDVADRRLGQRAPFACVVCALGKPGNAMALPLPLGSGWRHVSPGPNT